MSKRKIGVAYIPVLHRGYVDFLQGLEQNEVSELYLIGDDILASHEELDYINRKDRLRALTEEELRKTLSALITIPIQVLTVGTAMRIEKGEVLLVMPNEDINIVIAETYFSGYSIEYKNVFLRRHKNNLGEETEAKGASVTSLSSFEQSVIGAILTESEKSADWWRRVGAALVKNDELIALAHNEHMPEKELPNIIGDSRSLFKKGIHVDYVTAAHAEVGVIGEAARKGISTDGATLFVTDYPCPYCARLIAKSGIKKIYFMEGYDVLGGEEFFKDMKIETVKVKRGE
jgi:dCMP deaminase